MTHHDAIFKLYLQVISIRNDEAYDANNNIVHYDVAAVQSQVDASKYKEQRMLEYPFTGDQLDMLWHAINTNSLDKTSDFYTTIKAVKDKYPKS